MTSRFYINGVLYKTYTGAMNSVEQIYQLLDSRYHARGLYALEFYAGDVAEEIKDPFHARTIQGQSCAGT